jgi:hypothetical protein
MKRERVILMNVMGKNPLESKILASALKQSQGIYPVEVVSLQHEVKEQRGFQWDGELTLKSKGGAFSFLFEVKTHLRPQSVRNLLVQNSSRSRNQSRTKGILLFADYVNPELGSLLKEGGINFVDTAGNVFLKRDPGLYVYVEGKKLLPSKKSRAVRLSQPSGLTILYGLLLNPESVNQPYRQIAKRNGVALGTVSWVIRDLRENGYLEPLGKNRLRLIRKKDLFDRWVQGYASRLRPKLFLGDFRAPTKELTTVVGTIQKYALQHGILWGMTGGFGADALIHHYRGTTLTIFIEKWSEKVLKELRWLPSEGGPITVLKEFSPLIFDMSEKKERFPVVHPLLIYAELLYRGSERDLETAQLIYSKYLEPNFAKD